MSKKDNKELNTDSIDSKEKEKQDVKTQEKQVKDEKPQKAKKTTEQGKLKRKINETFAELKRVTWPSFKSILTKTGIVLAFCAGSLIILLLIDVLLKFLVGLFTGI